MYTKTVLTTAAVLAAALTTLLTTPAARATPATPAASAARAASAAGATPEVPAARAYAAPSGTVLGACGPGRLCLWSKPDFKGRAQTHELATTDLDSCVALPAGTSAQSLANRTGRPVTTYQSAECAEVGEFETYPGRGTWVPQAPYEVRAFKIWER
ncbi:peptidase inhibitor family I36 protein [Streptomyces sp. NPDC059534]|uniref:peptidase inhibitor family I36 protein n=1 Tax=Streptomyces sp. NPDC059534 TaxID=3346859 RepID=UPI0036B6BF78